MQIASRASMPALRSWRVPWFTLLIALVAGGMIHIASTLIIPKIATGTAWQRLAGPLPVNTMVVLPPATPQKQVLPFIGPDVRLAVCRYDVSKGPVVVTATLPDRGWTLGLYSSAGDNFYAVPAQDLRRLEVSFVLLPPAERLFGVFSWGRQPDASASQIVVPDGQGLIVIRAPMRGRAYVSETAANLARAQCGAQRS